MLLICTESDKTESRHDECARGAVKPSRHTWMQNIYSKAVHAVPALPASRAALSSLVVTHTDTHTPQTHSKMMGLFRSSSVPDQTSIATLYLIFD